MHLVRQTDRQANQETSAAGESLGVRVITTAAIASLDWLQAQFIMANVEQERVTMASDFRSTPRIDDQ